MIWITPKTDWVAEDRFNIQDFNRIRNNLIVVIGYLGSRYCIIEITDMGEEITDFSGYWNVDYFNAIEDNVQKISNYVTIDTGYKQTFYSNGAFIKYTELNRIERILNQFSNEVLGYLAGLSRLPMTLGRDRGLGF